MYLNSEKAVFIMLENFKKSSEYSKESKRRDRLLLSVAVSVFALYLAFSSVLFAGRCEKISGSVVRLHVLANSDEEGDQEVKLAVRDALLEKNSALLTDGVTVENAEEYFISSKKLLENTANEVLKEKGFSYNAKIKLCREFYPTRTYGDLTFPSGEYTSVKVVLGKGEGHNWWCVMFPPLCVPTATGEVTAEEDSVSEYITADGKEILESGKRYEVRFKLLEWWRRLFR